MRVVIQRVSHASVTVDETVIGESGTGILALIGFGKEDTPALAGSPVWNKLLDKLLHLRIFPDEAGKLNRSLTDIQGDLMLVSQFTLYANCKKGRRPSFTDACPPETAQALYDQFVSDVRAQAPGNVATGAFGAEMHLAFTNWGPVTLLLDSDDL